MEVYDIFIEEVDEPLEPAFARLESIAHVGVPPVREVYSYSTSKVHLISMLLFCILNISAASSTLLFDSCVVANSCEPLDEMIITPMDWLTGLKDQRQSSLNSFITSQSV